MKTEELVKFGQECWDEGTAARQGRMVLNRDNREAYLGVQDYSWKIEGQSTEFLPRVGVAVDQLSAGIKRGLVAFGDWFSVDVPKRSFLTGEDVRGLLQSYLKRLPDGGLQTVPFEVRVGDAIKQGLLESLLILKVTGEKGTVQRMARGKGEKLERREIDVWRLRIDLVGTDSYVVDPSGEGRYEIHEVERDWDYLVERSKGPDAIYDVSVLKDLEKSFVRDEREGKRGEVERGGNAYRHARPGRRVVTLREFWGDILNDDGTVFMKNAVMTVANEKWLVRKPVENPWWHQESPFVKVPLKRVPHSVWHAAMYDDAAKLNFALNELFNLLLDGALSSVWGVRQLRESWLEDPGEVAGGIPQGATLRVREDAPEGAKVVENLTQGQVPQDGLQMFGLLDKEFDSSARVSDLNKGQLPGRKALATEIIEASQGQSVLVDDIVGDVERTAIGPVLRKAWLVLMQGAEDLGNWDVVEAIGARKALRLSSMSAVERYSLFSNCGFKVFGLSATLLKGRDFQKFMALMQSTSQIPFLFQGLAKRFSPDKAIDQLWRMLNLNPQDFEKDEDERDDPRGMVDLMTIMDAMGPGGQKGLSSANTNVEAATVNQLGGPSEV